MYCVSYFIVLLTCAVQIKGLDEGESCTVNGSSGVCKNINDCPSAIEDIKQRRMPQICTFVRSESIVCCAEATTPKVTTTTEEYVPAYYDYEEEESDKPDQTCPPLDPSWTAPKTGQKAWDKCVEYQDQYVYPCKRSVALTGAGGYARGNNCKHSANQYIVNGEDAKLAEFPHMALLGYRPDDEITFACGGSVISESYILTAGHCTHGGRVLNAPVGYALVGILRRSDNYKPDNLYTIKTIIKHPDYKPPRKYNDIALLETDRPMKLSAYVVPACLDIGNQPADKATATGWGATAYIGSNADTLQKVNLTKFDTSDCRTWHKAERNMKIGFDERTQICYGDKTEAKDTCGGDSGGPLQIQSSSMRCMYVIVGVTSFGRQCGNVGQPGVYTKVVEYVPWIESVVWP